MEQHGLKKAANEKNRMLPLLKRIGVGVLLILLIGFLMYATLVAIMYFL